MLITRRVLVLTRDLLQLLPPSIRLQRRNTKVYHQKGVPMAYSKDTPFANFAVANPSDSTYVKTVWTLASILFDEQVPLAGEGSFTKNPENEPLVRKDRLITFWSRLCEGPKEESDKELRREERAFVKLTYHDIEGACLDLIENKDYRLATLIAQLGDGDQVIRDDMDSQIQTWRELNVLSEMVEPIRALYGLLAGKTCVCEGKKGHVEDVARDFTLSERFKLDWKRAFGLRLFYGTLFQEPIEKAVDLFAKDLESKNEPAKPTRTVIEFNGSAKPDPSSTDDLLWSLLKVYAASKEWMPFPSIASILCKQDIVQSNKLNVVLSFQLYYTLTLRFPSISNPMSGDALAVEYASQLEAIGEWLWAMFAIMHIDDSSRRQRGLQDLLGRHAMDFPNDPGHETFITLTQELKIPAPWIWQAKALGARASLITTSSGLQHSLNKAVLDARVMELTCLVRAGEWHEAHAVLIRSVAPKLIIGEDWHRLGELLLLFRECKENIQDWSGDSGGGAIYEDFLTLVRACGVTGEESSPSSAVTSSGSIDVGSPADGGETEEEAQARIAKAKDNTLRRLLDFLPAVAERQSSSNQVNRRHDGFVKSKGRNRGLSSSSSRAERENNISALSMTDRDALEESVALKEMSRFVVAEVLKQNQSVRRTGTGKGVFDLDGDAVHVQKGKEHERTGGKRGEQEQLKRKKAKRPDGGAEADEDGSDDVKHLEERLLRLPLTADVRRKAELLVGEREWFDDLVG